MSIFDKVKTILSSPKAQDILLNPGFVTALAAPIVGGAVGLAARQISKQKEVKAKANSFREMMELHPHLKQRDAKTVARLYNSLSNVNPVLAKDPLVAGAWVDNVLENTTPGMDSHQALLARVQEMAGIRNQLSSAFKNEGSSDAGGSTSRFISGIGEAVGRASSQGLESRRLDFNKSVEKAKEDLAEREREALSKLRATQDGFMKQRDAHINFIDSYLNHANKELKARGAPPVPDFIPEKKASKAEAPKLAQLLADLKV